ASNQLDNIQGLVNVFGGTGNHLNINDQGSTATYTYTITSSSVTRTGGINTIDYGGQATLVVNGSSGADIYNITGTSATTTVHGGTGANTLDYSGNGGSAIAVNLQTFAATATGGFSNINRLVGSSATTDQLTGANTNNIWTISGLNAGNVNGTFAFSAIENL